jgi:hypothetical protein
MATLPDLQKEMNNAMSKDSLTASMCTDDEHEKDEDGKHDHQGHGISRWETAGLPWLTRIVVETADGGHALCPLASSSRAAIASSNMGPLFSLLSPQSGQMSIRLAR